MRDSPSKTSKIVMNYISNLPDVGPKVPQHPVDYATLVEMSQVLDKGEVWARSDLRLIFYPKP